MIALSVAAASAGWLIQTGRRLAVARQGNFAILTALASVAIFGAAGFAYDYDNMLTIRSRMSDSLDAAAFEAAELYAEKASDATIEERAGKLFAADLQQFVGQGLYTFSYDGVGEDADAAYIKVSASATYEPTFMPVVWKLLGQPEQTLTVARQSKVALATSTVELALVLDNSGSMADSQKISTLKTAATNLVEQLFASAMPGDTDDPVKMSIVPFAGSVNVGPGNRSAAWMDTKGISPVHHENFDWTTISGARKAADGSWSLNGTPLTRFWLFDQMNSSWAGCVEARPAPYDTNNAPADPANPQTLYVPMFAPDEPDSSYWYDNSYFGDNVSTRYGSVPDATRQRNMTKYRTRYNSAGTSTRGPNYACSTIPLLPLSTSKTTIESRLKDMQPVGSTNIPQGIAWGLATLTPNGPFPGARAFDATRNIKAMVVMTDGENTYYSENNPNKSTYGAYGYAVNGRISAGTSNAGRYYDSAFTDSMNKHLLDACQTAKDDGVTVFTIALDVADGSSVKTMLNNCASSDCDRKLYFDAKSNADLTAAFGVIGSKISGLRLYR
ncbi:MAG: hypothetical protein ACTHJ3_18870 [Pararhizobium sp.]